MEQSLCDAQLRGSQLFVSACEAVGLEVAVRAWWKRPSVMHGTPRRKGKLQSLNVKAPRQLTTEETWLRDVVSKGDSSTVRSKFANAGIPERVIVGGQRITDLLLKDTVVQDAWQTVKDSGPRGKVAFTCMAVEHAKGCLDVQIDSAILQQDAAVLAPPQTQKCEAQRVSAWLSQGSSLDAPSVLVPSCPSYSGAISRQINPAGVYSPSIADAGTRRRSASPTKGMKSGGMYLPMGNEWRTTTRAISANDSPCSPSLQTDEERQARNRQLHDNKSQRRSDLLTIDHSPGNSLRSPNSLRSTCESFANGHIVTVDELPTSPLGTADELPSLRRVRRSKDAASVLSPAAAAAAAAAADAEAAAAATTAAATAATMAVAAATPATTSAAAAATAAATTAGSDAQNRSESLLAVRDSDPPHFSRRVTTGYIREAMPSLDFRKCTSEMTSTWSKLRGFQSARLNSDQNENPEHRKEKSSSPDMAPKRNAVSRQSSDIQGKRRSKQSSNFASWIMKVKDDEKVQAKAAEAEAAAEKKRGVERKAVRKETAGGLPKKNAVRCIQELRRIFDRFDEDGSGSIEPAEFPPLLAKVTKVPKGALDKAEIWKVWDKIDADGSGAISFFEFQEWYCKAFEVEQLTSIEKYPKPVSVGRFSSQQAPAEMQAPAEIIDIQAARIRNFAVETQIDVLEIEKIWQEFSSLDTDDSGGLDKEEFTVLLQQKIAPKGETIGTGMLNTFWRDVDDGGRGLVTFEEFASWYITFFLGDVSPMEQYYRVLGNRF